MKLGLVVAAVLAVGVGALGCGGSSGTVGGKVLVDGLPAQGQEVLLQGGTNKIATATTGADGAYQFKDIPEGAYLLSVDVASTLERQLQAAVVVKDPVTVPDLNFSGVASLTGTVTNAAKAPVSGAQVQLLGTQVSGSTDAAGRFVFSAVPTGTHTVSVTSGGSTGQADVTLAQGETQDVAVSLTAAPPATVTGQATFFAQTDLSVIEVSVPAAGVSAHVSADGHYSLSVPPGNWDIFAKAPYYPSQKIGHVTVASGETASVPAAALSLYTDLPTFGIQNGGWFMDDTSFGQTARTAVLLTLAAPDSMPAFYAFDLDTRSLRLISVGAEPTLSPDGKFAAIEGPSGVVVMTLGTVSGFVVDAPGSIENIRFSSDSSTLMFNANDAASTLVAVKLADQTVTRLPDFQDLDLGVDRRLVKTTDVAPFIWKLVSPQGVSTAFTNVPNVIVIDQGAFSGDAPPAVGLEACATAPCLLDVLAPSASAAVPSTWTPASDSFTTNISGGAWVLLNDGNGAALIDTESGTTTLLPATVSEGSFSMDASRFAYFDQGETQLFEHSLPLPDPATLTPVVTSAGSILGGWTSSSQFVGFDNAPVTGAAYRFTIDSGTLTLDSDYTAGSGQLLQGLVTLWLGTDGKARLSLGAGSVHAAPEGQTEPPSMVLAQVEIQGAPGSLTGAAGTKLAASWRDGKVWFFDGDAAPRSTLSFSANSGLLPFFDSLMLMPDVGGVLTLQDFDSGQRIEVLEPGRVDPSIDVSLMSPTSVVLTHSVNANGDEVGGAYALLPRFIAFTN